jgi:hypothetical protein
MSDYLITEIDATQGGRESDERASHRGLSILPAFGDEMSHHVFARQSGEQVSGGGFDEYRADAVETDLRISSCRFGSVRIEAGAVFAKHQCRACPKLSSSPNIRGRGLVQ